MEFLDFQQGPIRPPSEAQSLLIRTTKGCPWNHCTFCTLYKGMDFIVRPLEEIKRDIWAAKEHYQDHPFETCFLQDGDSFTMDTADLIEVLNTIKQAFPTITQISSYGRAQTMVKKSQQEMQAICDAGLNMLYCGIESGSVDVLKIMKKGITPKSILKSSEHAKKAGMKMMVFVILGLGGKDLSKEHVTETASILNAINPDEIRLLSLAVKPNTELGERVEKGKFTLLTEQEMIQEQYQILSQLNNVTGRFGNFHGINVLMELQGQLPQDKPALERVIEQFLALNHNNQLNFILGRRLNYYSCLSDLNNQLMFDTVQAEVDRVQQSGSADFEDIFHQLRRRMI